MTVIVTGAAGFIGSHVAQALLARGEAVVGLDNLNDYYSVDLKKARLSWLQDRPGFRFRQVDISDRDGVEAAFKEAGAVDGIVHLAAQAGVRYSLVNPYAYVQSNVMGQVVMLEAAMRCEGLRNFVYASTSSVYGANTELPFAPEHRVDRPISLYAATKRADELITYSYCHTRKLTATCLRFFTVYGPWGRPDMAAYLFADAIMAGKPITVFNEGRMRRDFTYIDDIVAGIVAALDRPAAPDVMGVRHATYNLGNSKSEELLDYVRILEAALGRKATIEFAPLQPGDVVATSADISASQRDLGFSPKTSLAEGLPRFATWYKWYHKVN